jgi:hypothetical protein
VLLALLLVGCATTPPGSWRSAFEPESPCYAVDLSDGVDTAEIDEFRLLFRCLNRHDHLRALEETVSALEQPDATGRPAAFSLIDATAGGVDLVPSMADFAATVSEVDPTPVLELLLGGLYGTPDARGGVLTPLAPALPSVADALLADTDDLLSTLVTDAADVRFALAELGRSDDPWDQDLRTALMTDALGVVSDPRGQAALDAWLVREPALLELVAPPLHDMIVRAQTRARLGDAVSTWSERRLLDPALGGLLHLYVVAPSGAAHTTGPTALDAGIRLLAAGDAPLSCSLDLLFLDLDVLEIDNLSLALLSAVAQTDLERVEDGLDLIGSLTGGGVADWVLERAVSAGLCQGLTQQMLDDLAAVDRLGDPEAIALLTVAVEALAVLQEEDPEALRHLIDAVVVLHEQEAVDPTLPALQVAREASLDDTLDALLSERHGALPAARLIDLAEALLRPSTQPLVAALARAGLGPSTQEAMRRLAAARRHPDSQLVDPGPVLGALDDDVPPRTTWEPVLRVLSVPAVATAALRPGTVTQSPQAWLASLLAGDTLSDLLRWLDSFDPR